MAVRTTEAAVKLVLAPGKDYRPGAELSPFIAVATSLVDWVVANAAKYKRTVPANLELLEAWLAAWAYKLSDQQLQTSNAGRSSASFKGQSAMGFKLNNYGIGATTMDTSRMLSALDEGRIASAAWVGKSLLDQLTYAQRN